MSWNVTALCTCSSCLPNKGNFVWHHTSLDPVSLSRKLKSQSEVVFCLANGLCGLFCVLVISDSAPHEIFFSRKSLGGETNIFLLNVITIPSECVRSPRHVTCDQGDDVVKGTG